METILAAKFVCLVLMIVYGMTCFGKLAYGQSVNQARMYMFGVPTAAFITLQWL